MELPTPVSALIHAATMVTAGIYLFLRLGPLFECCETALLLITWLGGLGAILGAIAGLISNDIKKVIAYSTMSQLGYMTVSCGCSQYSIALFHLINHAFFKALLFLSAGAIIHAFKDEQDMRKMGSAALLLPMTYSFVLLGIESMMAFPFITGFYSKDFLLELAIVPKNTTISVAYILTMLAAILTATYSTRLFICTFIGQPNFAITFVITNSSVKESFILHLPLTILSIGAAIFGFIASELFLNNLYVNQYSALQMELLTSMTLIKLITSMKQSALQQIQLFSFLLLLVSLPIFNSNLSNLKYKYITILTTLSLMTFKAFNNHLAHWNNYNGQIIVNCQTISLMVSRYWDRGLIELIGPLGLCRLFHLATLKLELLSTGFLPHTSFTLFSFTICLLLLTLT